ncbi:hypothetical protein CCB81_08825 [Armatimonadetes bacterium Uphvl-Ar2]|nr:hypothetical protein CCB81_08825 [Armatimonadetes bacterium Uphvl-Ar2]
MGLHHQAWRDLGLGALGWLDARTRIPRPRYELLCALRLRRGGGLDVPTRRWYPRNQPGFATVRIEPKWNAELKFAKTRFDSVRGPISTEWREANGKFQLTVSIPPNVRAEVVLPDGSTRQAGSGTWTYSCPLPQ